MANSFAVFPAILDPQPDPPQTYTLEDGTAYVVQNIGGMTSETELYVWRLRALELPLEVLSRADVILSPLVDPQPTMLTNNPLNLAFLVYDVSQLTPLRDSEVITRIFDDNGERFFMGLDLNVGPFLRHLY